MGLRGKDPVQRVARPRWLIFPAVSAVVLIATINGASVASACSCLPPENREVAVSRISSYDAVFHGTVVRTFPGAVIYAVDKVYSGDVSERVMVSRSNGETTCGPSTPPRGTSHLFVGTHQTGVIRASGADGCALVTEFLDGNSASLDEIVTEAHGAPSPPEATLGSRALTLAEWPLSWLADLRVVFGIAVLTLIAYVVHYRRSRHGTLQ